MPAVSVIVPIYNSASYLEESIGSIIAQTFSDWEMILVDDGSNDGSGDIALKYAEKDTRVRYFHKENSGVSASRNYGLDKAAGKYVMFLDSDDICHPQILELLYGAIEHDTGLSACLYKRFIKSPDYCPQVGEVGKELLHCLSDVYTALNKAGILHTPGAKLYHRDLLKRDAIRFDETLALGEDICFNLDYLNRINSAVIVPISLYYYRDTANSLSKNIRNDYAEIQMSILDKKIDFIKDNRIDFDFSPYAAGIVSDIGMNILKSRSSSKEKTARLKALKQHRITACCTLNRVGNNHLMALIFKYFPTSVLVFASKIRSF